MNLELKITKWNIKVGAVLLFFSVVVFFVFKGVFYFDLQYQESFFIRNEILEPQGNSRDFFDDLSLSAKSFFVWDLRDKKMLGGSNEEMQFPLASLAKLMTVLVASEISTSETVVRINQDDLDTDGDNGLVAGEKWKFSDIIDFILVTSSNDGAQALASVMGAFDSGLSGKTERELFIDKMNDEVKQLGMEQSFFLNETGLDINGTVSGAYGSAKDVTILVDKIMQDYPELLSLSSYKQIEVNSDILTHQIDNTNPEVENLPSVVASKTGFTDLAGGNLMVVFDAGINHKIVISVLGSTKDERFSDMDKLVWTTLEKIFNENQAL